MNVLVFDLVCYVSKDIKYADKQPIIPWGYSKSSRNDMLINLAIATVFSAWIAIQRSVEYKPLQFMSFVFMYIIFEKLKSFEAPSSPTLTRKGQKMDGIENGKEASSVSFISFWLYSFCIFDMSIYQHSAAYTGILNVIEYMGSSIAIALYNNQVNVLAYAHISLHSKPSL
ncbi:hypothetical protein HID58_080771 [Brassica napus]|uniref:Uncharacterized protein n=1 Tax=Brassica napus TaxID=3708 RepID=A0ABQ7Y5V7_BRANA|nr:hypothetical protein HID58_080771 [Brassica napus]